MPSDPLSDLLSDPYERGVLLLAQVAQVAQVAQTRT